MSVTRTPLTLRPIIWPPCTFPVPPGTAGVGSFKGVSTSSRDVSRSVSIPAVSTRQSVPHSQESSSSPVHKAAPLEGAR